MRILLLGAGLQGRAALYDLIRSQDVERVTVADTDVDRVRQFEPDLNDGKVVCRNVDAQDSESIYALMGESDAVIHLLPSHFRIQMARLAVASGTHFIDASYADPEYATLGPIAAARGVSILPEFGLDPGIDLVLTAQAVKELDEVHELFSYGAGIPEESAAKNALKYKISWSFEGVLNAYTRPARRIRKGRIEQVRASRLFAPANVHEVWVDGLGTLEAYPNGDAVRFVELLELSETIREAGRYSMRWPGHSEIWRNLISLQLLKNKPVRVNGTQVVPRQFLHDLLLPQLRYREGERDIALIRVVAAGLKNGLPRRITYQVLDYRDLKSGLLAMQRTVGFTVSIGAQMIVRGDIARHGLLSPVKDVPADRLVHELKVRGIFVQRREDAYL